jgi:hypothetical protein
MPATLRQAHDQILALLPAAITAIAVHYPDVASAPGFPPQASWARIHVEDGDDAGQVTLVGSDGSQRYETNGILTVEIYALAGDGRAKAQELGEAVLAAYRGKKTAGGVWFRRERVRDVGPDGTWYHVNAVIEYQYDTITPPEFDSRSVPGILGYWSANEGSSSNIINAVGGTVGSFIQPTPADRPLIIVLSNGVRALRFDAATQDMFLPEVAAMRHSPQLYLAWHLRKPATGNSGHLFAQWGAAERFSIQWLNNTRFEVKVAIDAVTFAQRNYNFTNAQLQAGGWLELTYDGNDATPSNRQKLWFDGADIATSGVAGTMPATLQPGDATDAWLNSLNGANNMNFDIAHFYWATQIPSDTIRAALRAHRAPVWD